MIDKVGKAEFSKGALMDLEIPLVSIGGIDEIRGEGICKSELEKSEVGIVVEDEAYKEDEDIASAFESEGVTGEDRPGSESGGESGSDASEVNEGDFVVVDEGASTVVMGGVKEISTVPPSVSEEEGLPNKVEEEDLDNPYPKKKIWITGVDWVRQRMLRRPQIR